LSTKGGGESLKLLMVEVKVEVKFIIA